MGATLGLAFVNVETLPENNFGFFQLLYIGATYAFILMTGSNMIKDGSELLLLVPAYAGVVGSIVLPVLGAVPDGAIVLFSGLGPNAQDEVSIGVGALAGSTIMLLTIPWVMSVLAGRVNLNSNGEGNYVKPRGAGSDWVKLSPPDAIRGTGVNLSPVIKYTAKIMLITLLPLFVIQVPSIFGDCTLLTHERHCQRYPYTAVFGCVIAVMMFGFYLWDQARIANTDEVKKDRIDMIRATAVNSHLLSLRGLFPSQVIDSEGLVTISADNKRFRNFLRPFFRQFDADNSGAIDKNEFGALLHNMGEVPGKETLDKLMLEIDKDGNGVVDFEEFVHAMVNLLQHPLQTSLKREGNDSKIVEGAGADDDDDDAEEEAEMPSDLAHLSPEQQQSRLIRRSCWTMFVGVSLVLIFSDPMVDVLSEIGRRTNIKPFYIAFCLAPLASNASEFIAAYAYALKKTEKTITISISSLLGAACMNNTFCLSIFLALVAVKKLKWVFAAETTAIVAIELVMYFVARRHTQTTISAFLVLSLFPLSLLLVAGLESLGFD